MTNHIAYAHISAVSAIFCRYISVIYVTRCVVCICNKVEYLDKEQSYKNSTKEVIS